MAALTNLGDYEAGLTPIRSDDSIVFDNADMADIADFNGDGLVNNADLQGLINYLKAGNGSTVPVPEPASIVLIGLGGLLLLRRSKAGKNKGACGHRSDN